MATGGAIRRARFRPQIRPVGDASLGSGRLVQAAYADPAERTALGARGPATPAGRKITRYALAYLQQEEPGSGTGVVTQGLVMEWTVNKNFDIYRPNTGKLLVPGARIWEMHYHTVGDEIRDHVKLAVYLYPKGQEPKSRTYLTCFSGAPGSCGLGQLDIPRIRSLRPMAIRR